MNNTKGVLVMNSVPESCDTCTFISYNCAKGKYDCYMTCEEISTEVHAKKKSEHCPIKPLPSTKSMFKQIDCSSRFDVDLAAVGWNECLKEIKGD